MWSSIEKAAKKAAKDANAAAKKMAETAEEQKKKIAENDFVKSGNDFVKTVSTQLQEAKYEIDDNKSLRQKQKAETERNINSTDGDRDPSDITWTDGSTRSLPGLRVFGMDATIDSNSNSNSDTDTDIDTALDTSLIRPRNLRQDTPSPSPKQKVKLPILMIPGIASSGLYIQKSGLDDKKYKGRRVWIDPAFIAEGKLEDDVKNWKVEISDSDSDNKDNNNDDDNNSDNNPKFADAEEDHEIRSAWLYHVALDKNMVDERPGNNVRPYEGFKAIELMMDGALGELKARVWVDCINFLEKEMGYVRGESMDAAPYDWRLFPMHTERRDGYLTKTMERVERMYEDNDHLPVILACHSLGCKMGHYFLNFCLREKGREWIDRHIHTFMPIGPPTLGAQMAMKMAMTGSGLLDLLDDVLISEDEGIIMYRSWGSGPWVMPREIPRGMFPPSIVRREGELGITIASDIDVYSLFADRDTPPVELRLTIVFREKIFASTEFVPLEMKFGPVTPLTKYKPRTPSSMILSFNETFYLAVPYIEDSDDLGSLVIYLEEPSGQLHQNKKMQTAKWAQSINRGISKIALGVTKAFGQVLRVAVCERPLHVKNSAFQTSSSFTNDGLPVVNSVIAICNCQGNIEAQKVLRQHEAENSVDEEDENYESQRPLVSGHCGGDGDQAIGSLSINLSYSPPPDFRKQPNTACTTKFAVASSEDISLPSPVVSRRRKYNTIHHDKVVYDSWHGKDLFDKDGFCSNTFHTYEEYYEKDPLGPVTKSAMDAPPVNCVRSIYGINVPTEISAVYRKNPVVIIGDSKADCRFMIDKSAAFPRTDIDDPAVRAMMEGYQLKDGIVTETPETLQNVPGTTEQRRCCGDGTVPYWSLVHCLNWKDSIPIVTADELEGAVHRPILSDKRFHALLQKYCIVDDPRPQE